MCLKWTHFLLLIFIKFLKIWFRVIPLTSVIAQIVILYWDNLDNSMKYAPFDVLNCTKSRSFILVCQISSKGYLILVFSILRVSSQWLWVSVPEESPRMWEKKTQLSIPWGSGLCSYVRTRGVNICQKEILPWASPHLSVEQHQVLGRISTHLGAPPYFSMSWHGEEGLLCLI